MWRSLRNGALMLLFGAALFLTVPVPRFEASHSHVVLDREGRLLGASIARDDQWRFPEAALVPERYALAVQHFEDRRFSYHPGVDPLALLRALHQNLSQGRVVSGASTLTMQVVRLSRGNPPRTLPEKLLEMALAVRLELALSKDEILALYASHAPFGGNTVGLEAAAFRYFGRPPAELSWGEAATLAVLPNAPALVHPGRHRDALRDKRDRLLLSMAAAGYLTEQDAALAMAEPLPEAPVPVPQRVPHLLGKARGLVHSTLDASLQARATEAVVQHSQRLAATGIHNAAAVILDVETGEVLAWVGNVPPSGPDDPHQSHVDVVTSRRSTGSTLKPLLYLAELQDGLLLPHELVPDHPTRFGGYAPENSDRRYDGAVTAAEALARSRNVPAVWMLKQYGIDRFHAWLGRMGMSTLDRPASDYGLTLVLGGAEGTLLELVSMYRHMAFSVNHADEPALGMVPTHWQGQPAAVPPREELDPGAAWLTLQALLEVNRPGVHGAWRSFGGSRRVAWKTGTSFGFRDGWAIGVTPEVAIGVWVGNASGEGRPDLTGYQAAAPLLFELFDLMPPSGWFPEPEDALVQVEVCAHSGMRAGPDCAETRWEKVPRHGALGPGCAYCELVHCDEGCAHRVDATCAQPEELHPTPWFVLPPSIEQYWVHRHPEHRSLPPLREGCEGSGAASEALALLSPRPGAEVYVPIELDGKRGRVVFEAAHRDPRERVFWHLDGRYVGETRDVHQMALAPPPGEHQLVVLDPSGARVERRFVVLDSGRRLAP
jgi:penicillin-binding protein 1C